MYLLKPSDPIAAAFLSISRYPTGWRKANSLQTVCEMAAEAYSLHKCSLWLLTKPLEHELVLSMWFRTNFYIDGTQKPEWAEGIAVAPLQP